jgi:hypothetical protein
MKGKIMKCLLCGKEGKGNFCGPCGMPLGVEVEFASANPGTGSATIACVNGNRYEVTFRDFRRTTMEIVE